MAASGVREAGGLLSLWVLFFTPSGASRNGAFPAGHRVDEVYPMPTLLLIDGSNYLFRAFHALPPLTTSRGEPTGALRGFVTMIGKVFSMARPDYAAIIFDAPGKNFRHELFPDYKAQRPPMPEELRAQIEPLLTMIPKLGWPLLQVPGVEADDVMGTLARAGAAKGMKVVLATGDKDMAQLVDENVVLLNTMNTKFYDVEGVKEKYGVYPERIIDYLALMGDKVDNVPGIDKCGPKTAAKWLDAYGSLDGIIEHADEIKGKVGGYLRDGIPFLGKAVELVTIKTDCELPEPYDAPEDLVLKPARLEDVKAFSDRWEISETSVRRGAPLGVEGEAKRVPRPSEPPKAAPVKAPATGQLDLFSGLSDEPAAPAGAADAALALPEAAAEDALNTDEVPFELVDSVEKLEVMVRILTASPALRPDAIEIAYSGTDRHPDVEWMSVALNPNQVWVVDMKSVDRASFVETVRPWIEGDRPKVFYEAKRIRHVFRSMGLEVGGRIDDTMLMSYVIESHLSHTLSSLANRWLRRWVEPREWLVGSETKKSAAPASLEALHRQMAEEVAVNRALHAVLSWRLAEEEGLNAIYEEVERPLMDVLFRMECEGVLVDRDRLVAQSAEIGTELVGLEAKAYEIAGRKFNLASPKQLGEVLFGELGLPVLKKTSSGAPSTNEEVLTELALDYPLPKIVLDVRSLSKLKSTYLDSLPREIDPEDGRVHTTFGQATAVTGRLASSNPNLQNIPVRTPEGRRVREAFVAREGCRILSADYSQIELRIMAHLSGDEGLLAAFRNGEDIHRATAAQVLGKPLDEVTPEERRHAKVVNFGLIYGMSAFGLAKNLGIERTAAQHYIDQYFQRYPGVKRYMDETRFKAKEQGYVETVFGRRLWLPDIQSPRRPVQQAAERAAINAPMQGTAADLIKRAMIAVRKWLDENHHRSRLILQIHDELILEVPEDEVELMKKEVARLMSEAATLSVPLIADVGVGDNWEEAH